MNHKQGLRHVSSSPPAAGPSPLAHPAHRPHHLTKNRRCFRAEKACLSLRYCGRSETTREGGGKTRKCSGNAWNGTRKLQTKGNIKGGVAPPPGTSPARSRTSRRRPRPPARPPPPAPPARAGSVSAVLLRIGHPHPGRRRRDCHLAGTPSPSLLKRLLQEEGVRQSGSLGEGGGASPCR